MNPKYPFRRMTAQILTAFAVLICVYSLYLEYYDETIIISVSGKLIIALLFVLACIIAALAFCFSTKDKEKRKQYIWNFFLFLFVYYLLMLIDLLFLDSNFGRTASANATFSEYLQQTCNFKPFHTIKRFWYGYENGIVSLQIMLINILGNFCAFMPMAFFLPVLMPRCRHALTFLLTIGITVFTVEALQILTRLGAGDIDDFILNVCGAMLIYLIMQLPFLKKNLAKIIA